MSRQVIVQPPADADIDDEFDYIAARNPSAARRFYKAAFETFEQIALLPGAGVLRSSADPALAGLRMRPIRGFPNYLAYYLTTDENVQIVRVIHGAREVERIFIPTPDA